MQGAGRSAMRQEDFRWVSPGSPASSVQGKSQIWGGGWTGRRHWHGTASLMNYVSRAPPRPRHSLSALSSLRSRAWEERGPEEESPRLGPMNGPPGALAHTGLFFESWLFWA